MGSSDYNADVYMARKSHAKLTGADLFAHDADIKTGKVSMAVHDALDPKKLNKAGKNIRESFDSKEHPNSRAVGIIYDVTGSMSNVPRIFSEKLEKLMAGLVKKDYIGDPHVLFGAIGDATCDKIPLQIGQFESGNEADTVLTSMYLESGGGGHITESYELAMYYMSRHTDLDCFNKRSEKGYLFLLGDEIPYDRVSKEQVKEFIGDTLQDDIPTKNILEELRDKFEVFWILPSQTSNCTNRDVLDPLKAMFGQRFLILQQPEDVCELIIATIGVNEGYNPTDIVADLKDIGADVDSIARASKALATFSTNTAIAKGGKLKGTIGKSNKKDLMERI